MGEPERSGDTTFGLRHEQPYVGARDHRRQRVTMAPGSLLRLAGRRTTQMQLRVQLGNTWQVAAGGLADDDAIG